ncbi:VRR-NUC domain-containing protein [Pseudogemmobacter sp. W21_MBD1_M6]|uniref:VRR-NUC domain-containing protein n=1 Tax=Pseudogemmobacter sp. W21_MBD1_M6 TaxID=3240271 RepID=UPI003F9CB25D
MKRRGTPEADLQRAVVVALRFALPKGAIVHHCANEVTEAGPRGARRQAILVGMGVHPGFADLIVLCDGRVLFLELKSLKGRLSPAQEAFRDAVLALGFGWALVRSLDDALGALADHGFTTRIVQVGTPEAPRDAGARHDGTALLARRATS